MMIRGINTNMRSEWSRSFYYFKFLWAERRDRIRTITETKTNFSGSLKEDLKNELYWLEKTIEAGKDIQDKVNALKEEFITKYRAVISASERLKECERQQTTSPTTRPTVNSKLPALQLD